MRYSYLDIKTEESALLYRYSWDTILVWDEEEYNDNRYWKWQTGRDGNFKYSIDAGHQIILAFTENHPFYNWFTLIEYKSNSNNKVLFGDQREYNPCQIVEQWFLKTYKPKGFFIP